MTSPASASVASHRARMAIKGFVRVEVAVRREDAGLMRQVAAVLSDPSRRDAARALLRHRFADTPEVDLKALLAAAPLEGISLDRSNDLGRDVDI